MWIEHYDKLPSYNNRIPCRACGYKNTGIKFHSGKDVISYNDECNIFEAHIDRCCERCGFLQQTKLYEKKIKVEGK